MSVEGFKNSQRLDNSLKEMNSLDGNHVNIKGAENVAEEMDFEELKEVFDSAHPQENEEIIMMKSDGYKVVVDLELPLEGNNPLHAENARIVILENNYKDLEARAVAINQETNTYETISSPEIEYYIKMLKENYIRETYITSPFMDSMHNIQ